MARQTADKDQPRRAFEHFSIPSIASPWPFSPPAIHTPSPVLQSPWCAPCPAASPSCFPIQSAVCCGCAPSSQEWPIQPRPIHPPAFFHFHPVLSSVCVSLCTSLFLSMLSVCACLCPISVPLCSRQCRRHTKQDYEPTAQYREYLHRGTSSNAVLGLLIAWECLLLFPSY